MWGLGNLWAREVGNTSASPMVHCPTSYMSVMHNEIRVLVVDHESDDLIHTAKQLELCHYKVSLVELASRAMQMLSTGKVKFDFIVANINSPDLHGFNLLRQAASMSIPIITMSFEDSAFTALRSVENGAFFYIKKPTTKEMFEPMWQHLAKDKIRIVREKERFLPTGYNARGIEFREVVHPVNQQNSTNIGNNMFSPGNIGGINSNDVGSIRGISNMLAVDKDIDKLKKDNYMDGLRGVREENYEERSYRFNAKIRRKVCTEWTQELHEKFMAAVTQLGEGRCFPKDIIELMDVPGLTRMQVASHLQKCRNDNWRSPEERKTIPKSTQIAPSDTDHGVGQKPRRFGSMPKLGTTTSTMKETRTEGGTTAGGGSKTQNSEIGLIIVSGGVDQSAETGSVFIGMANNNNNNPVDLVSPPPPLPPPYQEGYGPIAPRSGNMGLPVIGLGNYTANLGSNTTEDYFNFADDGMDCLVPNYSASGGATDDTSVGHYHFESTYRHHGQSSKAPSQWSPETPSTFESDRDTEMGGH